MGEPYSGNVTPRAQLAQDTAAGPVVQTIQLSDLREALRLGWEDFKAVPSHAIILCVIYPVLGLVAGAHGAWLLGAATAVSAGCGLCPGCGVGFLFAVVALCVSVVSFPLMLDRHAGAGDAMVTSLRAVARNPVPMASRHRSLIVPRMRCNTQYCFADPGSRWSMASVTVAALRRTAEEALHRVRDTTGTSEALF